MRKLRIFSYLGLDTSYHIVAFLWRLPLTLTPGSAVSGTNLLWPLPLLSGYFRSLADKFLAVSSPLALYKHSPTVIGVYSKDSEYTPKVATWRGARFLIYQDYVDGNSQCTFIGKGGGSVLLRWHMHGIAESAMLLYTAQNPPNIYRR